MRAIDIALLFILWITHLFLCVSLASILYSLSLGYFCSSILSLSTQCQYSSLFALHAHPLSYTHTVGIPPFWLLLPFPFFPTATLPPSILYLWNPLWIPTVRALCPSGGNQTCIFCTSSLAASFLSDLAWLPLCPAFLLWNSSVQFLTEKSTLCRWISIPPYTIETA